MNLLRKLTLAGVGLVFVLGLAVIESNAQRRGRSYGNRSYRGVSVRIQPRYNNSYTTSRYSRNYNRGRYGLSWRERRILAARRHRMIRAQNRYYRTRSRIINRRAGYGRNVYYRNY